MNEEPLPIGGTITWTDGRYVFELDGKEVNQSVFEKQFGTFFEDYLRSIQSVNKKET